MHIKKKDELGNYISSIPFNSILRRKTDYERAVWATDSLGLARHRDPPKNWDSLAALQVIYQNVSKYRTRILDAGGEYDSVILAHLSLYGYKKLICINPSFINQKLVGNILYRPGDISCTQFKDNYFDAITCLSVIEHGVNIQDYFKETARILKRGGILFTSTDYWRTSINAHNQFAYGVPIQIFDQDQILNSIRIAKKCGLKLLGNLNLKCLHKPIEWGYPIKLRYTFIYFTLMKC